ncbi:AGE family epimerase/isomerase [Horticoccus sp. 23ND18S-11]|uniref:AGE family epimerase/isomerase n=1 Tax=Horticoccus sp. 23ND18S-11 TaxID=3391832 RepID=UPI0039C8EBF7
MKALPGEDMTGGAALDSRFGRLAREELVGSILPFWTRTTDLERGGIFNCWNNAGTTLVSRDKFTWSQGRFVWLWSRVAGAVRRGLLPGDASAYLDQAARTVQFLQRHAFLDDGRCAFLLSEDGVVKEAAPGSGPAPSIYADCFVVMGFAEFARVTGHIDVLDAAWRLFENIERRIAAGGFPTRPEPIPDGYDSHAIAMITLNVTLVLREACEALGDRRAPAARGRNVAAAARIVDRFLGPGGRVRELVPRDQRNDDTLLSRHLNPGHALEGLWMLLTVAQREGRVDWSIRALEAVRFALERGWDAEHGGLLHYVDCAGGVPVGQAGDTIYERGVRTTWDAKLWWIHSEAIYATALSAHLSGDAGLRGWFERVWTYTLQTFPQPDRAVGEWIQIRDRRGAPLERVVALPVKDPYHIARNLLQLVELFPPSGASLSS